MTEKTSVDIDLYIKNLSDANDEVREDAAAGLVGVFDKRVILPLTKIMETETNPGVKYFAKKALALLQKEYGDLGKIIEAPADSVQETKPVEIATAFSAMPAETRENVDSIMKRIKQNDASLLEEALGNLSKETDVFVRATYICAVGRLGNQDHMEAIVVFLSDEDFRVIANTVEALERLQNPKCVEYLVKLISHRDNRVRANVIKALWKFTTANVTINQHVIERLQRMMASDSKEMRESALFVLSEVADEAAIDLLTDATYEQDEVFSKKASEMLEKAQKKYSERKENGDDSYISGVIEKLSRGAADATKGIDDATRAHIDKIQKSIDSAEKSKLPEFIKQLQSEKNSFIRATLISAVGRLGSRSDMDSLIQFTKDPDVRVVANVVQALEMLGNPKCVEHIVKLVAHPDHRVRANTVKTIWKYAHTNVTANRIVIERLKEMMFSTKGEMREAAIYVLGEIADDESIELLTMAGNDKNAAIKAKASEALSNAMKLKAERELKLSETEPVSEEEVVKIPILEEKPVVMEVSPEEKNIAEASAPPSPPKESAAEKAPEPKAENQPEKADDSKDVQKTIDEKTRLEIDRIQRLIDSKDASSIESLARQLKNEQNAFIRATLVAAVGKLGTRTNMEDVLPMLEDADTRVAANAAEALELLGNSKCVEELIKHINHSDNRMRANVVKAIWKYAQSNVSANKLIINRLKTMMFSTKTQMRESALYVLGEIANEEAFELISIAVTDKVESVQQKAKEALAHAEEKRRARSKTANEVKGVAAERDSGSKTQLKKQDEAEKKSDVKAHEKTPVKSQPQAVVSAAPAAVQSRLAAVKADQLPPAVSAQPVKKMSFFKFMFFLAFLLSFMGCAAFSVYWFALEGKSYDELVVLVKQYAGTQAPAPIASDVKAGSASSSQAPADAGAKQPSTAEVKKEFNINEQMEIAKQYLSEGSYSETISLLTKNLKKYPQNADLKKTLMEAYYKRGQSFFNLEIYDAAKSEFDKILSMDDKSGGYALKAQGFLEKISKIDKK